MVSFAVKKLDDGSFLLILKWTACNCDYCTGRIPLDFAQDHGRVHRDRVVVFVIFHQYQSALLIRNAKPDWSLFWVHDWVFVPIDTCQGNARLEEILWLYNPLEACHCNLVQKLPVFVVYKNFTFCVTNEELFGVGGPADHGDFDLVLFAPSSVALNATDNYMAIFVCNTDFSAVGTPFHVFDGRYFSVIDHFFNPLIIIFHKHDYFAGRIAGGQLSVLIIPANQINVPRVRLDVDALVRWSALLFVTIGVQFEQFEKTVTGADCQPALVKVPGAGVRCRLRGNCNFLLKKCEHGLRYLNI